MITMIEDRDSSNDAQLSASRVRHIAKLAKLRITDADAHDYAQQLARIMEHFQSLQAIDLKGIEPLAHPTSQTLGLQADQPSPPLPRTTLLNLAPESAPPFIKVPKVLSSETSP